MYQKCVCFLFLVMLAIFSCSGFRIDSLAMTDLTDTKKNSLPFSPSPFQLRDQRRPNHHRLRHQRHYPSRETSPTLFPSQQLAQIPPTDVSITRRLGRSRRAWLPKQPEDFFWKAYQAEQVYLAVLTGRHRNATGCEVYFKVKRDFQGHRPGFKSAVDCRLLDNIYAARNLFKEFALLENSTSSGEATITARLTDKIDMHKFNKTRRHGFEPRKARNLTVSEKHSNRKNRILVCKVEGGFPVPKISWRRKNGGDLYRKGHYRILYKRKKSKLIIKKSGAEFLGEYECVATSPDGKTLSKSFHLLPPRSSETIISTDSRECDDKYLKDYCLNDGKCLQDEMGVRRCECPTGTTGERCEHKSPSDPSMYPQPELYSCKLGLSTKYNC